MQTRSPYWFLAPHLLSCVCFAAAFLWMASVETNRSTPDLVLGIAGFAALAAALLSSIAAVVIVLRRDAGRGWPWLLVHLAGLAVTLALASNWLGAHIA